MAAAPHSIAIRGWPGFHSASRRSMNPDLTAHHCVDLGLLLGIGIAAKFFQILTSYPNLEEYFIMHGLLVAAPARPID